MEYTFDTFIVGKSNRLAYTAAMEVVTNLGHAGNPLFIYSGVGTGKTHLLHAISHDVLSKNHKCVLYVTSETFVSGLIEAVMKGILDEFREKYREADALMIDDIQFLSGKASSQEELIYLIDVLKSYGKLVVLSSDRPPKKIPNMNEHLLARIEGGIIADIQPPDLEMRIAILRKVAQADGIVIPDDVINYIAENIKSNIYKLKGALSRVALYASASAEPITEETAIEALKNIYIEEER